MGAQPFRLVDAQVPLGVALLAPGLPLLVLLRGRGCGLGPLGAVVVLPGVDELPRVRHAGLVDCVVRHAGPLPAAADLSASSPGCPAGTARTAAPWTGRRRPAPPRRPR